MNFKEDQRVNVHYQSPSKGSKLTTIAGRVEAIETDLKGIYLIVELDEPLPYVPHVVHDRRYDETGIYYMSGVLQDRTPARVIRVPVGVIKS